MRFLADESCDFAVVRALRSAGHDVTAISELSPGMADEAVLEQAARLGNILLTEDRDFGRLVHAYGRQSAAVIFIRYPASARRALPKAVTDFVTHHGERLAGSFVVMQPGRTRIGR